MNNARGRTFWATIDRISNQGNGVVEKEGGGHFIVGPVTEDVVGKTVEVRMVGPNEAELVDSDFRKDVFAGPGEELDTRLTDGDIISGRVTKLSTDGTPIIERDGVRIRIPGASLNERVTVQLSGFDIDNPRWNSANGKIVGGGLPEHPAEGGGSIGTTHSDVELYNEPPMGVFDVANTLEADRSGPTRLLHLTDSHLGSSLATDTHYTEENRCFKGLRRAIEIGLEHDVDAVLNTGDLFHNDSTHGIPNAIVDRVSDELARLAAKGIPFYSIDGDHEGELGRSILSSLESEGLTTHLIGQPHEVGRGIALIGRDYSSKDEWSSGRWRPQQTPSNRYTIFAIHQSIAGISNNSNPDCTVDDIVGTVGVNAQVIAAGHLHTERIAWKSDLPFVIGGTTEPQRARRASHSPSAGIFVQHDETLRYQRIQLFS